MRRPKLLRADQEAGLRLPRLKPGQARGPRRLVPWWARMLKRVEASRRVRHQSKRGAGAAARSVSQARRLYGRRSVVKASFRRNQHNRGWTAHARYLAREGAQREQGRGLGFDAAREDLDLVAAVNEWERDDGLMWSFIVSPEDADRIDLRQHVRELVAGMERDLGTRLEWVAIDHHNTDDAHVHLLVRGVLRMAGCSRLSASISRTVSASSVKNESSGNLGRGSSARFCSRANVSSNVSSGPRSTGRSSGGRGSIGW